MKQRRGRGHCGPDAVGDVSEHTNLTVCEPTLHPVDGHPDLYFRHPADGTFITATDPSTVLSLIQRIRELEERIENLEATLADAEAHVVELVERLISSMDDRERLAFNQANEARHMRKK